MGRKYSKESGRKVERALHEMKEGALRSGRSGKKVKSRKQAIAIGLSEARREGARMPKKSSGNKGSTRRESSSRGRNFRPHRLGTHAKAAHSST
jgi:hypothetical protein